MAKLPKPPAGLLADVRGGVRLIVDGLTGVTGIVESMHHRIARASPPLGTVRDEPTRGITGLVYRSIQGTTSLVGQVTGVASLSGVYLGAAGNGSAHALALTTAVIAPVLVVTAGCALLATRRGRPARRRQPPARRGARSRAEASR